MERVSSDLYCILSPAFVYPDDSEIKVKLFYTPPATFSLLCDALASRSMAILETALFPTSENEHSVVLKERKEEKMRIIDAFQKLSWMMEHCRFSNTQKLRLECGKDAVVLDLRTLGPKKCFSCPNAGNFVACARCNTCCWCSETCLRTGYEQHTYVCKEGSARKEFFGL